ncbi:phosphodiester glycosidase family protein [Nocardioides aquiterrae]|uniref:Phosphodiester glycosidase domain-containing protein n=1 Tax=Nocardioides aquiterrae TaxID=203799 RepID=A0ABP4EZF6_9ACTN
MRIRLTLSAGLVACALAAGAPALAGNPSDPGPDRSPDGPRKLHPKHTSGGEPGVIAAPRTSASFRTTTTDRVSWRVAPGVQYTRWSQTDARGPIVAHLLTVDPSTPGLKIDYASMGAVRRVAPVRDILATDGAVAGVNGDFYDIGHTGAPLGLGKDRQRGLLHARQDGWNNAFFINRNGRAGIDDLPMTAKVLYHPQVHVTNLNSSFVTPGGLGIYTPRFGRTAGYAVTQGQTERVRQVMVRDGRVVSNRARLANDAVIPGMMLVGRGDNAALLRKQFPTGTRVKVQWSLRGRPQMAISGNRFLVHDGIIRAVDDRELHPRTAIGVDADTGEVLILVVDGRSSRSRGYTMVELANLMIDLGADEAINLDGGGSSTMVGRNRKGRTAVLNTPSDGFQRWVANAVAIEYHKP